MFPSPSRYRLLIIKLGEWEEEEEEESDYTEEGERESKVKSNRDARRSIFYLTARNLSGKETRIGCSFVVLARNRGVIVIFTYISTGCVRTGRDVYSRSAVISIERSSDFGRIPKSAINFESVIASPVRCQKFRLKTSWCYHVLSANFMMHPPPPPLPLPSTLFPL